MSGYEELKRALGERPRTWLVTGAAGFIGSHLLEALLSLDQQVVGLDNFSTGKRENLQGVRQALGEAKWRRLRFIEGDIRSLATCQEACGGADVVLHQAALGSVPRSIDDPIASHASNVSGFLNMLVAARDCGVRRFVYAASSAVYGDSPELPKVEARIGRPLSPYAATKLMNEVYADVFARCYAFESVGLRYFNVFGPRQDPEGAYAAVIPRWIAALLHGEPVFINGDGETARDFCYVDNAVQANLLAATSEEPQALNQVYNIAVNERTSLNELFLAIRSALEPLHPQVRSVEPVHRDFRPGDVRISQADIGKAQALLGYRPAWRVRQGLEHTVRWYAGRITARSPGAPAVV